MQRRQWPRWRYILTIRGWTVSPLPPPTRYVSCLILCCRSHPDFSYFSAINDDWTFKFYSNWRDIVIHIDRKNFTVVQIIVVVNFFRIFFVFSFIFNLSNELVNWGIDLPTNARITVNKGAAGNRADTLNSNIWSRSTETRKRGRIWDYRSFTKKNNDFYYNKELMSLMIVDKEQSL